MGIARMTRASFSHAALFFFVIRTFLFFSPSSGKFIPTLGPRHFLCKLHAYSTFSSGYSPNLPQRSYQGNSKLLEFGEIVWTHQFANISCFKASVEAPLCLLKNLQILNPEKHTLKQTELFCLQTGEFKYLDFHPLFVASLQEV